MEVAEAEPEETLEEAQLTFSEFYLAFTYWLHRSTDSNGGINTCSLKRFCTTNSRIGRCGESLEDDEDVDGGAPEKYISKWHGRYNPDTARYLHLSVDSDEER